jgi:alpha-glucosidase
MFILNTLFFTSGFSKAPKTWLPVHKNYKQLNLAKQKIQLQSHYHLFKNLIKLRSSNSLKQGSLNIDVINNNLVLVVSRLHSNEGVLLLINFSDDTMQRIDATKYLPGSKKAIVVISSVGSDIKWG